MALEYTDYKMSMIKLKDHFKNLIIKGLGLQVKKRQRKNDEQKNYNHVEGYKEEIHPIIPKRYVSIINEFETQISSSVGSPFLINYYRNMRTVEMYGLLFPKMSDELGENNICYSKDSNVVFLGVRKNPTSYDIVEALFGLASTVRVGNKCVRNGFEIEEFQRQNRGVMFSKGYADVLSNRFFGAKNGRPGYVTNMDACYWLATLTEKIVEPLPTFGLNNVKPVIMNQMFLNADGAKLVEVMNWYADGVVGPVMDPQGTGFVAVLKAIDSMYDKNNHPNAIVSTLNDIVEYLMRAYGRKIIQEGRFNVETNEWFMHFKMFLDQIPKTLTINEIEVPININVLGSKVYNMLFQDSAYQNALNQQQKAM